MTGPALSRLAWKQRISKRSFISPITVGASQKKTGIRFLNRSGAQVSPTCQAKEWAWPTSRYWYGDMGGASGLIRYCTKGALFRSPFPMMYQANEYDPG